MSISQRKHIRLTLDIPVFRFNNEGGKIATLLYQISIGGCLIEWDETIAQDDIFRLEMQLPNKNWLPLECKAVYVVKNDSIGVQFQNITQFEQELVVEVMSKNLAEEGIPLKVDPFSQPKTFVSEETNKSEIDCNMEENEETVVTVN